MEKISAVYKIVNTITGEFYIGSSVNVKKRWSDHKTPSIWKSNPNKLIYKDFQKYGLDKFRFQILCPVMEEYLKDVEQELIEMLQPVYNDKRASGLDVERHRVAHRKANKKYRQTEKGREAARKAQEKANHSEKRKEYLRNYSKKYHQSDEYKESRKKYRQTEKGHEAYRKANKKYYSQLCLYNGETLTLCALYLRFSRAGIENPRIEAKKYLIH